MNEKIGNQLSHIWTEIEELPEVFTNLLLETDYSIIVLSDKNDTISCNHDTIS